MAVAEYLPSKHFFYNLSQTTMEFTTDNSLKAGYFYPIRPLFSVEEEIPWLQPLYFDWEKRIHAAGAVHWTRQNYYVSVMAVFAYLLFCFFGQRFMKNKQPFDLKTPLKFWNLALAIFSLIGSVKMWSVLFLYMYHFGFLRVLSFPPAYCCASGAPALWATLFTHSKYLELFDTVFIVLRKKELSFLHWYHHATVLLYTWDAFCVEQPSGLFFMTINYSVHAIMYFYFFLVAHLNRRLSWGICVTIAQITQMFVGVAITIISIFLYTHHPYSDDWKEEYLTRPFEVLPHYISLKNLIFACCMYSTYVYLFIDFFVSRYSKSKPLVQRKKSSISAPTSTPASTSPTSASVDSLAAAANDTKQDGRHLRRMKLRAARDSHSNADIDDDDANQMATAFAPSSQSQNSSQIKSKEVFLSDTSNSTRCSDDERDLVRRVTVSRGKA